MLSIIMLLTEEVDNLVDGLKYNFINEVSLQEKTYKLNALKKLCYYFGGLAK